MASTTALYTGLSGVLANSRMLDVVGNNIANVNTTAFKSNRLMFAPTFSRTFSLGTAPSDSTGGSNPGQIGLGVSIAGTQRNFNNGALSGTGVNTDLAIEGNGFFVVDSGDTRYFTRNGAFLRNSQNELVTQTGARLQGYGVDANFNVVEGTLQPVTVPIGTLTLAEATDNVIFSGNLNASGDVATAGSTIAFAALSALPTAVPPPSNPPAADDTTRLVDLDDGTGNPLFTAGQSIRLSGAEKGGKTIPDAELAVDATTTVADYMAFLEAAMGIDTSVATDPGGVGIDPATGVITIESNYGTANDLTIDTTDIAIVDSAGTAVATPFTSTKSASADGESVRTTFIVYDSLGTPLQVDLTLVLDSTDDSGTTWRYFAESADSVGIDLRLGTGTISFDTSGQIIEPADFSIAVQRDDTGAVDPLSISMAFSSDSNNVTALTDSTSELAAVFQDGSPIGTLNDFSIGEDGVISGSFTNGLIRTIGQVALATFTNNEGLVDGGDGLFRTGPNSGTAVISSPLTFGGGRVVSGTLELANVDLSQEFINLILASTGYSASSRVINTTNELIQQLLLIGR